MRKVCGKKKVYKVKTDEVEGSVEVQLVSSCNRIYYKMSCGIEELSVKEVETIKETWKIPSANVSDKKCEKFCYV